MTFSESLMEICENRNGLCLAVCSVLPKHVEKKWLEVYFVKHQEKIAVYDQYS